MPASRGPRGPATRYTPIPQRSGTNAYSPWTKLSATDGWSLCPCGTGCETYIFHARMAADGKTSKDLCIGCRLSVRNDLFRRFSDALGIRGAKCAGWFVVTGTVGPDLTDPSGHSCTSKRLGHINPTKPITRNLADTETFNAYPTSQLFEEFVGSDNINDLFAPDNIAATVIRFKRWFDLRSDADRQAFMPSSLASLIQSPITSITERLELLETAMGSPMNVDDANVSNTGDVTLGVDLVSRNTIYNPAYEGPWHRSLVFGPERSGIGSRIGPKRSGIGSRIGAGSMNRH
jgi:hypothetical protein